jgi:hypothetical protein
MELFGIFRASLEFNLTKGMASKFTGNQRTSSSAVSELTVSLTIIGAARGCFARLSAHPHVCGLTGKLGDTSQQSPGALLLTYRICTCVAMQRVLDCFRLLAKFASGDDGDVFSPFPQGYVTQHTSFRIILGAIINGVMLQPPSFSQSIASEQGIIIGSR